MSVAVPSTPQSAVDRLRHAQHLRRQADAIELQAIADELDVDTDTVHTRAVTLDDQERAAIAARLNDIHLP